MTNSHSGTEAIFRSLPALAMLAVSKRTMSGIGKSAPFREKAPCRPQRRTRDKQLAQPRRRLGASIVGLACHAVGRLRFPTKGSRMPIIRANAGIITQINVFTVPMGGQQALIDHLSEAARFSRDTPGWLSASLHRSQDGTRVVNYAQSESPEAAQRVITRIREAGLLDHKGLGQASPGLYDVVFTLER